MNNVIHKVFVLPTYFMILHTYYIIVRLYYSLSLIYNMYLLILYVIDNLCFHLIYYILYLYGIKIDVNVQLFVLSQSY